MIGIPLPLNDGSAFLLDGSSDISLASAAEEAAREACRWTAKDIFHARRREGLGGGGGGEHHDRVVDNREEGSTSKSTGDDSGVDGGDDGGDDESPAKKIDKFPRSWLVASYFCGYEQLSIALSVYESNNFLSKNILQEASDTMTTSTTTAAVDHHHDHDDDGTATGADIDESCDIEPLFLAPPVYLLNPRNSNSDSNRSSCCRLDSEAYTLLVCLVELMEHVTYDEQSNEASINAQDNATDSTDAMKAVVMDMERHHRRHSPSSIGNRPDHGGGDDDTVSNGRSDGGTQTNGDDMRLFEITGTDTPVDHSTSSSVSFIELISGFTGIDGDDLDYHHHHCMPNDIVLEGQCRVDQHIANTHTPPSQDYIDATVTGRTVPPCASFYRAFSLLYREDRSITGDSSAAAAADNDDDDGGGAINSFSDTSTKVSATPVYLDELLSSVGALTSDCIHRLTGVVFAADGSIASVLDYPVPPPSSPSKMVVATNALDGRECSSGEAVDEDDNSNDRIDQDDDCWETVSNAGDDDDDDDDDGRIGDDVSRSIANEVSIALEQIRIEIDNAKIRYKEVECPSEVIEPTTQAAAEAEAPLIPSDHDNNEDGVRNNSCHDEVTDCSSSSCPLTLDVSHRLRARLLNICGSVAFLLGDAVGAVKCFRASIQQDDQLLDSQVKLGSLLVDMDELDEVCVVKTWCCCIRYYYI